jgi:hypothetical protein
VKPGPEGLVNTESPLEKGGFSYLQHRSRRGANPLIATICYLPAALSLHARRHRFSPADAPLIDPRV